MAERRRESDESVDILSTLIGVMSGKVDTLSGTVNGLAVTITDQHEETIKYRALNDVKIESIADTVDQHEEIASHINTDHLEELNDNLEYVRSLRERAQFWAALRERILSNTVEKSIWTVMLIVAGAVLYTFAPELSKKLIQFTK